MSSPSLGKNNLKFGSTINSSTKVQKYVHLKQLNLVFEIMAQRLRIATMLKALHIFLNYDKIGRYEKHLFHICLTIPISCL